MNSPDAPISRHTVSFGWGLAAASLLDALLVVAKEKSLAVQSAMKSLTGHHWITHVLAVLLVFAACGFGLPKMKTSPLRMVKSIVTAVMAAAVIIVGFYLVAD